MTKLIYKIATFIDYWIFFGFATKISNDFTSIQKSLTKAKENNERIIKLLNELECKRKKK